MKFERLKNSDEIKDIIRQAFGVELDISGGWGYDLDNPVQIKLDDISQKNQIEFTFAMMRATLEMSLTQPKESRYAGINVKEIKREDLDGIEKVTFEISAMKESDYNHFIQEYKDGFGKDDFDINKHFEERKRATLIREIDHYFLIKN